MDGVSYRSSSKEEGMGASPSTVAGMGACRDILSWIWGM